ncbi:MAG: hypothetical protein NT029_02350 [Armatimonadetes bacterium]|nr:hypothetical protein [Armatimonadota bacterium]
MLSPAIVAAATLLFSPPPGGRPQGQFSDAEKATLVAYWAEPGRYTAEPAYLTPKREPWQVRLTTQASRWLWDYQKAVAPPLIPPTADAAAAPDRASWETWVAAKVAYDRSIAQASADAANGVQPTRTTTPAPHPGPAPAAMVAALGNPPPFASAVTPLRHTVTFGEGDRVQMVDNVAVRPRYAYYRFATGVMDPGTPVRAMQEAELAELFVAAGLSDTEAHVMRAVSPLEGGFDAINTYDTGYISIGFIQFITGEKGDRSLLEVLADERSAGPEAFQQDFRAYGIDASPAGVLTVIDPTTGAELSGADAVQKVIDDKRLTAVFGRAGRRSPAFRRSQLRVAKAHYWPGEDVLTVGVPDGPVTCKVSDIVRSEAGLATLYDRKVNRGTLEPLPAVVGKLMRDKGLTSPAEAAGYEREIVTAMKYRKDFLADRTLSQPK